MRYLLPVNVLLLLSGAGISFASPPPPRIYTPGEVMGSTKSQWLLPYVRYQLEGIADAGCESCCGTGSVRWYSLEGEVVREVRNVSRSSGFLTQREPPLILGLDPYWEMKPVSRPRPRSADAYIQRDGYIGATPTGNVFVHQYWPTIETVAVDVYRGGRLTETIGPYPCDWRASVRVVPSGAFALSVNDTTSATPTHVVLVDPQGRVTGELDMTGWPEVVGPIGRGIIVRRREPDGKWWLVPGQVPVRLDVWPGSSRVRSWLGDRGLFSEWHEDGDRLTMIDLANGQSIWTSQMPTPSSVQVFDEWILVYEVQTETRRDRTSGWHQVRALRSVDGHEDYVWRSTTEHPPPDPARLVELNGSVYFVTDERFSRIDRDHLESEWYGWKSTAPPPPPEPVTELVSEFRISTELTVQVGPRWIEWHLTQEAARTVTVTHPSDHLAAVRYKVSYSVGGGDWQESVSGSGPSERIAGALQRVPKAEPDVRVRVVVAIVEVPLGYYGRGLFGSNVKVLWQSITEGRWE